MPEHLRAFQLQSDKHAAITPVQAPDEFGRSLLHPTKCSHPGAPTDPHVHVPLRKNCVHQRGQQESDTDHHTVFPVAPREATGILHLQNCVQ